MAQYGLSRYDSGIYGPFLQVTNKSVPVFVIRALRAHVRLIVKPNRNSLVGSTGQLRGGLIPLRLGQSITIPQTQVNASHLERLRSAGFVAVSERVVKVSGTLNL